MKYDKFFRKIWELRAENIRDIYVYHTGDELSFGATCYILKKVGVIEKFKGIIVSNNHSNSSLPMFVSRTEKIPEKIEGTCILVPYLLRFSKQRYEEIEKTLLDRGLKADKDFIELGFDPYCKVLFYRD